MTGRLVTMPIRQIWRCSTANIRELCLFFPKLDIRDGVAVLCQPSFQLVNHAHEHQIAGESPIRAHDLVILDEDLDVGIEIEELRQPCSDSVQVSPNEPVAEVGGVILCGESTEEPLSSFPLCVLG